MVDVVDAGANSHFTISISKAWGFKRRDVLRFAGWTSKGGWIDGHRAAEEYDTSGSQDRDDGVSTGGNGCGCDKLLTFSPVPNTRHSRDTSNGEQR